MMLRKVILFVTLVLVSLTAGRAFWTWVTENPVNLSGATYVEFFQALERSISIPIRVTAIGGFVLAGISAILFRSDRRVFYLLLATCGFCLVANLVTIFVNKPINAQILTWNPSALPQNYRELLSRWWQWHYVRLFTLLAAMTLLFIATLISKESPQRS